MPELPTTEGLASTASDGLHVPCWCACFGPEADGRQPQRQRRELFHKPYATTSACLRFGSSLDSTASNLETGRTTESVSRQIRRSVAKRRNNIYRAPDRTSFESRSK